MATVELDRIDLKIINILQRDNSITNAELADAVAVSAPTCLRRVRRLREEGVITADVCLVDPQKIGSYLMVIVEVELRDDKRPAMDSFENILKRQECVMQCYLVTGEFDYILFVCVKDMSEYEKFVREMICADSQVKRFKTLIVMSRVKFDTMLPIASR